MKSVRLKHLNSSESFLRWPEYCFLGMPSKRDPLVLVTLLSFWHPDKGIVVQQFDTWRCQIAGRKEPNEGVCLLYVSCRSN